MNRIILILGMLFSCTKIDVQTAQEKVSGDNMVASRPNIILILGDDIGWENLTCNGGSSYETPNLDSLAYAGIRYTNCHSQPLCSPSRFELLTGKYNFRNYFRWGSMTTDNKTIANMLKDAGYRTGVFGKWQLDGGDTSIRAFGFDRYNVWEAFADFSDSSDAETLKRYKNPTLYSNKITTHYSNGEYGEDLIMDSLKSFISDGSQPFFAFYPSILCHPPFQPTPDDSEYAAFTGNVSDTKYYPSMMKYMDKKIGQLMTYIDSLGIGSNTVIIWVSDNGTGQGITSILNGKPYTGGKGLTSEHGTHVPLIVKGIGIGVSNKLIDLSDFMPTIADIANVSLPNFGTLDGVNFWHGKQRDLIYFWYSKQVNGIRDSTRLDIWVQGRNFKRYSFASLAQDYKTNAFFKIIQASETQSQIITQDEMTAAQIVLDSVYLAAIDSIHNGN